MKHRRNRDQRKKQPRLPPRPQQRRQPQLKGHLQRRHRQHRPHWKIFLKNLKEPDLFWQYRQRPRVEICHAVCRNFFPDRKRELSAVRTLHLEGGPGKSQLGGPHFLDSPVRIAVEALFSMKIGLPLLDIVSMICWYLKFEFEWENMIFHQSRSDCLMLNEV